jgi:hypothetical protein
MQYSAISGENFKHWNKLPTILRYNNYITKQSIIPRHNHCSSKKQHCPIPCPSTGMASVLTSNHEAIIPRYTSNQ